MDIPGRIEPLEPGDTRTLLSAEVANQLIAAINSLLNMKGGNGIIIRRSDANFIIELQSDNSSETPAAPDNPGGGGGSGSFNWRGQWDPLSDYVVGDVTLISDDTAMQNGGIAGLFRCKATAGHGTAAPTAYTPGSYWDCVVPLAFKFFTVKNTDVVSGSVFKLAIDPLNDIEAARGSSAPSTTVKLNEILVCDAGTEKKAITPTSATY